MPPFCRSKSCLSVHRRGIPYVESLDEQITRELWETDPFSTAVSVVNAVLDAPKVIGDDDSKLLIQVERPSSQTSGFEYLFESLLYNHTNGSTETLYHDLLAPNVTKDKRRHFLLRLAYRGSDFCGWQSQANNHQLPSIQQTLEEWLEKLEGDRVDIRVCGRTDAGVHAIGQIARYRSHQEDLPVHVVQEHLLELSTKSGLKCLGILPVSKSFHPSFGAESRAYVYLIDVEHLKDPSRVATVLQGQLQSLQGQALDYVALSYGKLKTQTAICTLYHAQCCIVESPRKGHRALCIELVGDRFLRRMVRMLVDTALRIAVLPNVPKDDALKKYIENRDRGLYGNVAPPDGLIFVGATFATPTT